MFELDSPESVFELFYIGYSLFLIFIQFFFCFLEILFFNKTNETKN